MYLEIILKLNNHISKTFPEPSIKVKDGILTTKTIKYLYSMEVINMLMDNVEKDPLDIVDNLLLAKTNTIKTMSKKDNTKIMYYMHIQVLEIIKKFIIKEEKV